MWLKFNHTPMSKVHLGYLNIFMFDLVKHIPDNQERKLNHLKLVLVQIFTSSYLIWDHLLNKHEYNENK